MSDDFGARLIAHTQVVLPRAEKAQTEAATQQYLILPFFQLPGYDPLDPDEIIPQARASFSDKFPNLVDYAICLGGMHRFEFADGSTVETGDLRSIDEQLRAAYTKRVEELG